jgi:L-amino acid N-acyltransferase YncA
VTSTTGVTIRPAMLDTAGLARDAQACAAIYAPYVTDTVVSFEAVPPTPDELAERIAAYGTSHAWLVAEWAADGAASRVVGYAYGAPYSSREAYRWSVETTVYLAPDAPRRSGLGRALYTALLDRLAERGYLRAIAGVALPNDASVGLHRAVGFEDVGTLRRVGWKLGAWHDVLRMQRDLGENHDDPPREPR